MKPLDKLRDWFRRDFLDFPLDDVEARVDQEHVGEIRFEMGKFCYTITADTLHGQSYLGCIAKDRTRPKWKDLPDGEFNEETWADIVKAIREMEVVKPVGR